MTGDFETTHTAVFGGHGAAVDAHPSLAAESVDLVVTSPPYPMIGMWDAAFAAEDPGIGEALADGRGPEAFERMHVILDGVWDACSRLLKPGGLACINVGDATRSVNGAFRLYSNHARIISACERLGFETLPSVLWRKQTNAPTKFMGSGMLPGGAYVTLEHEYVLILRKGGRRRFTGAERERRRRSAFFWEERNRWFSDLWDLKGVAQMMPPSAGAARARDRTAAFPFELAHRLILMYSLEQDTVLDPFLGTGTTTVASIAAGRNSIAAEIDESLRTVVLDTVAAAATRANDPVMERLAAHRRFLEERAAAGKPQPTHTSTVYGFPVMTSQETDIRLSIVRQVERPAAGETSATRQGPDAEQLRAVHRYLEAADFNGGASPPEVRGFRSER